MSTDFPRDEEGGALLHEFLAEWSKGNGGFARFAPGSRDGGLGRLVPELMTASPSCTDLARRSVCSNFTSGGTGNASRKRRRPASATAAPVRECAKGLARSAGALPARAADACPLVLHARLLVEAIDDQFKSGHGVSIPPAKRMRLLRSSGSSAPHAAFVSRRSALAPRRPAARVGNCTDPDVADFLSPLPAAIAAAALSFLSFGDTARCVKVSLGAAAVLRLGTSWDPLVVDQQGSRALLRYLRERDPVGVGRCDASPVLSGLFNTTRVSVELMSPDRRPGAGARSHTHGVASANSWREPAIPPQRVVLDPLDEIVKRFRAGCFSSVTHLELRNIEDHRLDCRFLQLRGSTLAGFPYVRVEATPDEAGPSSSSVYTLRAWRGASAPAGWRRLVPAQAETASASRRPAVARLPQQASCIDDVEARFIEEHTAVFKAGNSFHASHAPWRGFSARSVRECYKPIMDAGRL